MDYIWDDPELDVSACQEHMFAQFKLEVSERNFDVLIIDAVNAMTEDYSNYYEFTKKNPKWTVSGIWLGRQRYL